MTMGLAHEMALHKTPRIQRGVRYRESCRHPHPLKPVARQVCDAMIAMVCIDCGTTVEERDG